MGLTACIGLVYLTCVKLVLELLDGDYLIELITMSDSIDVVVILVVLAKHSWRPRPCLRFLVLNSFWMVLFGALLPGEADGGANLLHSDFGSAELMSSTLSSLSLEQVGNKWPCVFQHTAYICSGHLQAAQTWAVKEHSARQCVGLPHPWQLNDLGGRATAAPTA